MLKLQTLIPLLFVLLLIAKVSSNASLTLEELKKYENLIERQGLYSTDDDVNILTVDNFKNELYGKKYAWVIQFHHRWCGFCQKFAPFWKALGTDIKSWSDIIKIGEIDCQDDDNNPICHQFKIISYPTLLYFHENYVEAPENLGVDVSKVKDMQGQKEFIIERMLLEQNSGRGVFFPDLHPSSPTSVENILDYVPDQTKYAFLLIYNYTANSYLGPELILDLHAVPDIAIRYTFSNNTQFLSNIPHALPTLYAVEKSSKLSTNLGERLSSKTDIKEAIRKFLKRRSNEIPNIPDKTAITQARQNHTLMQKIKKMGDIVFQMDLETALRHSFKREVAAVTAINGEKLEALKAYLSVLAKYFPFGQKGQMFLSDVKHTVDSSGTTLITTNLRNMIQEAEADNSLVFSSPKQWLGCKGSSLEFRGYPCGVWKMFHYLTVAAAEYNSGSRPGSNPREVLDAMHRYIKHFFGCADCSQHFQQMAERKNLKDVSSYDSSVLWLWMAHNEVNKRLAGDQTEDPEYPKQQFPIKERCPQCRFANESWNYPEVLNYVKQVYSSINIIKQL